MEETQFLWPLGAQTRTHSLRSSALLAVPASLQSRSWPQYSDNENSVTRTSASLGNCGVVVSKYNLSAVLKVDIFDKSF